MSAQGMAMFKRVLSERNKSFSFSRGSSGNNGVRRRWSTGTVETGDRNTGTTRR